MSTTVGNRSSEDTANWPEHVTSMVTEHRSFAVFVVDLRTGHAEQFVGDLIYSNARHYAQGFNQDERDKARRLNQPVEREYFAVEVLTTYRTLS